MKTPDQILDKCEQLLHGFVSKTKTYNTDQIEFAKNKRKNSKRIGNRKIENVWCRCCTPQID